MTSPNHASFEFFVQIDGLREDGLPSPASAMQMTISVSLMAQLHVLQALCKSHGLSEIRQPRNEGKAPDGSSYIFAEQEFIVTGDAFQVRYRKGRDDTWFRTVPQNLALIDTAYRERVVSGDTSVLELSGRLGASRFIQQQAVTPNLTTTLRSESQIVSDVLADLRAQRTRLTTGTPVWFANVAVCDSAAVLESRLTEPESHKTAEATLQPLSAGQLAEKYGTDSSWGEHPEFSRGTWQDEVATGDVQSGYWDWVVSQIAQESDDDEGTDHKQTGAGLPRQN